MLCVKSKFSLQLFMTELCASFVILLNINMFLSELKAIQDKELHKGPDYHYLSRPERYSEAVRKASCFIRCIHDKTLNGRIDTYYFGKSVRFAMLLFFYGWHWTVFPLLYLV